MKAQLITLKGVANLEATFVATNGDRYCSHLLQEAVVETQCPYIDNSGELRNETIIIKTETLTEPVEGVLDWDGVLLEGHYLPKESLLYRDREKSFSSMEVIKEETIDIGLPSGWVEVGKQYMKIDWNSKYQPCLLLVADWPQIKWLDASPSVFNMGKGSLSIMYGKYRTTKAGKPLFDVLPQEQAPHVLILDSWGGAFNDYRGGQIFDLPNILWQNRRRSNGGGAGNDYAIVPIGTKMAYSID